MTDIIERAEAALAEYHRSCCYGLDMGHPYPLLGQLLEALKSERAHNERLMEAIRDEGIGHLV
jgi:hypothetical protein